QGKGLKIVLVDDGSDDGTAQIAASVAGIDLTLREGKPLPADWSGKLWALQQGFDEVRTPWVLLLDADILLAPGMAAALLSKARRDGCRLVSIMASLRMESGWEKLLMPAFIYFFKLLYPFRLANSSYRAFSAAAGGCILLETGLLRELGGFSAIKNQVIDDCSLAREFKRAGHRIWVGQSHSVTSLRRYETLEPIWEMVARTAFTQLRYSAGWLGLCTLLMGVLFWGPIGLLWVGGKAQAGSIVAYAGMMLTYWPTLRYYGKNPLWAGLLPLIATLYLAMTWTSALRYWRGERSRWKNRVYAVRE
ncbi:MAG: glycosyltransferase, partial [Methylococcaceae bacterium]|nr:glycosyltransferase [Methylococcaceae bacterium]